jgi:hypothetical protein
MVQEDVVGFCDRALSIGGWVRGKSLVVDGVRHVVVLNTLRQIVEPDYFGLVYLNIDRQTQRERWNREDLPYKKTLEELERHPTEIEVLNTLPDFSDLVLDGKLPVQTIVTDIRQWCESGDFRGNWDERNQRRIELAKRFSRNEIDPDEAKEFDLLQRSYFEYLATKHGSPDAHAERLLLLEAKMNKTQVST